MEFSVAESLGGFSTIPACDCLRNQNAPSGAFKKLDLSTAYPDSKSVDFAAVAASIDVRDKPLSDLVCQQVPR